MECTNKYVQRFEEALIAKGTAESNFYKAQDDLWNEFTYKKDWQLFLARHGLDLDKETCNCHDYDFYFCGDDKMQIRLEDYFHGEYSYYKTDKFKVSEFCDFLNSDDYYGPKLKRLESLKAIWDKHKKEKKAKEDKERRKKLYEELKKEFE